MGAEALRLRSGLCIFVYSFAACASGCLKVRKNVQQKWRIEVRKERREAQYESDIKKKEVELIGNYEKGFKVYKNGKLKTGMISEVKKNAGFSDEEYSSRYEYIIEEEKLYKINKKNKKLLIFLKKHCNIAQRQMCAREKHSDGNLEENPLLAETRIFLRKTRRIILWQS